MKPTLTLAKGSICCLLCIMPLTYNNDTKQKLPFQFLEEYILELKPLRRTFKNRQICSKIFQQVDDVTA